MRQAARRIVEKLRLHGHEAFFAGGWVRDYLLRRKPKDIDIATSALPEQILQLFSSSKSVGEQFGVVQISMYGHTYDIATFRKDNEYQDGRHPLSVTFSSPEQDALRRDFTINGLFFDPVSGRLIDYIHGRKDIRNKRIRTIGDPLQRFSEDKLRMLRAIRFACELGFTIVPETWMAIQKLAPGILQVSWERIRDEICRILTSPDPASGFDMLYRSGLLSPIMPEIQEICAVPELLARTRTAMTLLRHPSVVVAFAALLQVIGTSTVHGSGVLESSTFPAGIGSQIPEGICRRLKMSNEETKRISSLVENLDGFEKVPSMRESGLKRFLRQQHFGDLLEVYRIHCLSGNKKLETYEFCRRKLSEYGSQLKAQLLVSGEDLIGMGYSPGPDFSEILRNVEDLQLEGILQTREQALAHIKASFPIHKGNLKSEV
jgi:tRNA nucleotidyltransferase/poly(A) polymerase